MQQVLVCGRVAIDIIGKYAGTFTTYEKLHGLSGLNVSLQLSSLDYSFGGCAINIAFGLHKLGVGAIPLAIAGQNFEERYRNHLQRLGLETRYILVDPDFERCATAIILSDTEGNQLTAFHSGPARSKLELLPRQIEQLDSVSLAIVAPDDAPMMLRHARDLHALQIPFMFDPGQGLAEFESAQIEELIELASHIIVNDHEWEVLRNLTGRAVLDICTQVSSVVVTRGRQGSSVILHDGTQVDIPAVSTAFPLDATGCGDAFRAGYLTGLLQGRNLQICGRMGALLATYNLESMQTQNYHFTRQEYLDRFERTFGSSLPINGAPPTD